MEIRRKSIPDRRYGRSKGTAMRMRLVCPKGQEGEENKASVANPQ